MHVLNLVTKRDFAPFKQQVEILQQQGLEVTTLEVPAERRVTDDEISSRSLSDYIRLSAQSFRSSFGPYDVIHANYGLTLPAALAQPNLPVVATLWGSDLMGKYGSIVSGCARCANEVIVRSEEMAAELGTDSHVIPHGLDLDLFRPIPQFHARRAVGWSQDTKHVLFPYPITRDVKDYPRAERVVEETSQKLSCEITLQTISNVAHEKMPLYLNAADALLLTSKREGSPNSVKEAMACNVPVVSTEVGDVPERLAGVDPSHVCQTDADLVDGLVDALQRGPESNGRETAKELSIERMGKRIRRVYESVH